MQNSQEPVQVRVFEGASAYLAFLQDAHSAAAHAELETRVKEIINTVRQQGDSALHGYNLQFDQVQSSTLRVPAAALSAALSSVDPGIRDVWVQAIQQIEAFHTRQLEDSRLEFFPDGTVLGWKVTPIDRVGLYIPGGTAVYPSSLFMNAVPAKLAGVGELVLVSPPSGEDGLPHKDILAAAALLDLDQVYAVGGAQAIAALAYGTESVPAVYKITGPGNQYVAEAKRQVSGVVGIDSVAGPSELVVLCDSDVPIEYLARDLLSQAEHDAMARALLITTSTAQARQVADRLAALIPTLPRQPMLRGAFAHTSGVVRVSSLEEGLALVNELAPEHLALLTDDALATLAEVRNAGAIFLGVHTPEPVGDYFAGPNHTIPTEGRARFSSPLSVQDFQKKSSVLRYSAQRLAQESEAIQQFALREQLPAHAEALRVRQRSGVARS